MMRFPFSFCRKTWLDQAYVTLILTVALVNNASVFGEDADLWSEFWKDRIEVVKISSDGWNSLAYLRADGSVVVSGDIDFGGDRERRTEPAPPIVLPLGDVGRVLMANGFALLEQESGEVWGAGKGFFESLESDSVLDDDKLKRVALGGVKDFTAWDQFAFLLHEDGNVSIYYGNKIQAGYDFGVESPGESFEVVAQMEGAESIAATRSRIWLVKGDGSLWVIEFSRPEQRFLEPRLVVETGVEGISAGDDHAVIFKNEGSVWTWGEDGDWGKLGTPDKSASGDFTQILDTGAIGVFAQDRSTLVYMEDGSLWGCGENRYGNLVDWEQEYFPTLVKIFEKGVRSLAFGRTRLGTSTQLYLSRTDGSTWTHDTSLFSGISMEQVDEPYRDIDYGAPVANAGPDIITSDGRGLGQAYVVLDARASHDAWKIVEWKWSWGEYEAFGEAVSAPFPLGNTEVRLTVTNADGLTNTVSMTVSVGEYLGAENVTTHVNRSFVIKEDGSLWAWGDNSYGALGLSNDFPRLKQLHSLDFANASEVVTGEDATFIVTKDGELWACGANGVGQLGDGSLVNRDRFVQILDGGVESVSFEENFAAIVMADGSVRITGSQSHRNGIEPTEIFRGPVRLLVAYEAGLFHQDDTGTIYETTVREEISDPTPVGEAPLFEQMHLMYQGASVFGVYGIDSANRLWGLSRVESVPAHRVYESVIVPGEAYRMSSEVVASFDVDAFTGMYAIATEDGAAFAGSDGRAFGFPRRPRYTWLNQWDLVLSKDVEQVSVGANYAFYKMADGALYCEAKANAVNPPSSSVNAVPPPMVEWIDKGVPYLFLPPVSNRSNVGPVADAGQDRNVGSLLGVGIQEVSLDATGSYDDRAIISWDWSWEGGSATGQASSGLFPVGTTQVELTVTDAEGLQDTDTVLVTVREGSKIEKVFVNSRELYLKTEDGSLIINTRFAHERLGRSIPRDVYDSRTIGAGVLFDGDLKQCDIGESHGLIVGVDGSLWGFGDNAQGQLGVGFASMSEPCIQLMDQGVAEVSVGEEHSLVLMDDGSVWASGRNDNGQLCIDTGGTSKIVFQKVIESGAAQVKARDSFSVVRFQDGSVRAYGASWWNDLEFPQVVVDDGAVDVSVSDDAILVLKEDLSLWVMGNGNTHWWTYDWGFERLDNQLWLHDEGPVTELFSSTMPIYRDRDGNLNYSGEIVPYIFTNDLRIGDRQTFFSSKVKSIDANREGCVAFVREDGTLFWNREYETYSSEAVPLVPASDSIVYGWHVLKPKDGVSAIEAPEVEALEDVLLLVGPSSYDVSIHDYRSVRPDIITDGVIVQTEVNIFDETGEEILDNWLTVGVYTLEFVAKDHLGNKGKSTAKIEVVSYTTFIDWLSEYELDVDLSDGAYPLASEIDSDGDSFSNWNEYRFGMNPSVAEYLEARIRKTNRGVSVYIDELPEHLEGHRLSVRASMNLKTWFKLPLDVEDMGNEIMADQYGFRFYQFTLDPSE